MRNVTVRHYDVGREWLCWFILIRKNTALRMYNLSNCTRWVTSPAPVRSSYQIVYSRVVVVGELLTQLFADAYALLKFNGNINTYCLCCVLFFKALFTRYYSVAVAGIYYLQLNDLGVRSHFSFCLSLQ